MKGGHEQIQPNDSGTIWSTKKDSITETIPCIEADSEIIATTHEEEQTTKNNEVSNTIQSSNEDNISTTPLWKCVHLN